MASASDPPAHPALQPADQLILPPQPPPPAVETSIGPPHCPPEAPSQTRSFNRACAPARGTQTLIRFVGILRGQKSLKRRFSRRSPVGEWSRGARSMPRVLAGVPAVSRPRSSATATMQLYFRRSGSSRDTVLQNQVERAA